MGTRLNRHYNNPAIGAAFGNLASIFAPPDATDVLAYAQAAKARQELSGLEQLYNMAGDPNLDTGQFDRLGAITGQWSPTSGFGARDMASADRRYGTDVGAGVAMRGQDIASGDSRYSTDVGAQTALATNANTVRGSTIGSLFGPVSEGQIRPEVPDEVMSAIGLPGVGQVTGLPKAKTAEQVEGDMLLEAIGGGLYGPQDAANAARSGINIEEIIGATGDPQIVSRADAIGQRPYTAPGSAPAMVIKTYQTPDGLTGTAVFDPSAGTMVDQATKTPLPQGTITGDITDTQSGMTTSTNTEVQKMGLAVNDTKATVQRLQQMIAENPGSTGLAGRLRGTVQDVIATGDDLARQWGGQIAELQTAIAENPDLAAVVGPNGFDPSIPAIDMQSTLLAFQLAKVLAGGDRISNQQFDYARSMVGSSSILANTQMSATKLDEILRFLDGVAQRREGVQATPIARVNEGLGRAPASPAAPAGVPPVGAVVEGHRFLGGDPNDMRSWEPVQ